MRLLRLRFRRMSLRLVLGLVAIVAVGLGWMVHRVRVQEEGIELIRRHGGMYYYDLEYDDANYPKAPRSWAPGWLTRKLGIDYFHHVASVRIEDPHFDDEDLGRLTACLLRIESIGIVGTSITDAGLTHLRGNRRLKGLWLGKNRINDAGIDKPRPGDYAVLLHVRGTGVSATTVAAVKAIFDVRESAARKAHPKTRISCAHGPHRLRPAAILGSRPAGRVPDKHHPKTIRAVETKLVPAQ